MFCRRSLATAPVDMQKLPLDTRRIVIGDAEFQRIVARRPQESLRMGISPVGVFGMPWQRLIPRSQTSTWLIDETSRHGESVVTCFSQVSCEELS
ncbi:MAG: hypothetical protein H6822_30710 [Planctomycetaceae bacterium]|nr:hypothetical protein [Planctomycetales bacterium]MCB9926552.1 hypothetical protein [Planctomycetaceae bacterium]